MDQAVARPLVTRAQSAASLATVALAALAASAGLFVPGLYRDPQVLVDQALGQDLLTLAVAVPALAISLVLARRGSLRAYVGWLGVTGYVLYTYLTYALLSTVNELYLVYTTLVFLSLYAFLGGMVRLDAGTLKEAVGDHAVWPYVAFEVLLAILVGALWLSEVVPASLAGTAPPSAAEAGLTVNPIHSLDLGVILPAFLLTAYWLSRGKRWGYAFTAVLLAKAATLGLAILAMVLTMTLGGQTVPLPQVVVFAAISLAALGLLARFLHAMRPAPETPAHTRAALGDD